MGNNKEEKIKIIACRTIKQEVEAVRFPGYEVEYIESGYHRYPDKLKNLLQAYLDQETEADKVVLGYGLCSNGVAGLVSRDKTLIIPRVHDCIGLLLGSREKYEQEFKADPGTYYLSRGWIEELREPYAEYLEYLEKFGEELAIWSIEMQYKNYSRLVFIYTREKDLKKYQDYAKKVAEFLNVKFEIIKGETKFFDKLISGKWEDDPENFLIVPPGKTVKSSDFL